MSALYIATLDGGHGLKARVMSYGATLLNLWAPDRYGTSRDVVLGFDAPEGWLGAHPYFGATIGRYANRIARAELPLDRRDHALMANEGRNQLHGGLRGFDKVGWAPFDEGPHHVRFRYVSADGDQGFPGELVAELTYRLGDDVLEMEWAATCDAPTVVNLTNHAYWNLAGKGDVLGHELELFASRFLPVNDELLPTGALRAVEDTPMDFFLPRRIGARLDENEVQLRLASGGYDHCWVLDGGPIAARLVEPRSGRGFELSTTQPGLQFYSGNQLDGSLRGKDSVAYAKYAGLCLEPQHFPDSPHHAHFPSTALRPGERYLQRASYRFFVDAT